MQIYGHILSNERLGIQEHTCPIICIIKKTIVILLRIGSKIPQGYNGLKGNQV